MNQNSQRILEKIQKLLAKAESARNTSSLEEAEAFASKAQSLLQEYNLSLHDVSVFEEAKEFENYVIHPGLSYKDNQASHTWKFLLASTLTEFYFTKFVYKSRSKTLQFIGERVNVDTCILLYNYLSTFFFSKALEQYKNRSENLNNVSRYNFLASYTKGCVMGLRSKLSQSLPQDYRQGLMASQKKIDKFLAASFDNLKTSRNIKQTKVVTEVYSEGKKTGFNTNLTPGIKNTQSSPRLLN